MMSSYHILVEPPDVLHCCPVWISIAIITDRNIDFKVLYEYTNVNVSRVLKK